MKTLELERKLVELSDQLQAFYTGTKGRQNCESVKTDILISITLLTEAREILKKSQKPWYKRIWR